MIKGPITLALFMLLCAWWPRNEALDWAGDDYGGDESEENDVAVQQAFQPSPTAAARGEKRTADDGFHDNFAPNGNAKYRFIGLGKRHIDKMLFNVGLGKRHIDKMLFNVGLGKRHIDKMLFNVGLGKRHIDKMLFNVGLGKRTSTDGPQKRKIDILRFNVGLGKRQARPTPWDLSPETFDESDRMQISNSPDHVVKRSYVQEPGDKIYKERSSNPGISHETRSDPCEIEPTTVSCKMSKRLFVVNSARRPFYPRQFDRRIYWIGLGK